ncbi:ABC transporter permease [Butyrivibrio sp. TB]|uniref:ABC transporter permease n=1 Tax=Butyrivibrio sp. TB TaxID=1520809 RepID=UPI0008AF326D|nr:ABC transporter permease [Butyrivibrio sp. TB]SEP83472.1 teichoic acid transport system permease protein [Butyrivibrio sp. TB]
MLFILNILMFIVPAIVSLIIHNYLRHGEMLGKRKAIFFVVYLLLLNAITYGVSWARGVRSLDFSHMTISYRLKFMGLGALLGFIVPFVVCLLTEDIITIGGFVRYGKRFTKDLRKYMPYAIWAAKSDLGAEVASSYLNWLWWLIEPFCMMIIYTVIFGYVFKASEQYFPVFIFTGITMWGFFSRSVNGSVNTVRNGKDIITKIYMPKYILLLSKMFVNGFKMMVSFGVIAVMMLVFRVPINWNVIWMIPILAVLFLFTFGVGSIMMHYGVYVNDLGYITGIVLQMMMYLSGVFYKISKRIPEPFGEMIENFNPVALLISSMRSAIMYQETPRLGIIAVWGFISLVLMALGVFTIYSNENSYVKVI